MRMLIQSKTVRDLIEERLKVNPVRTFDQITQEILDKYDYKTITVSILIADGNQTAARDYIINYMDKFDKESGKYIDFFVPGYCEKISDSAVSIEKRYHPNAYENGFVWMIYQCSLLEGIKQHIILINFYLMILLKKWKQRCALSIHTIRC